MPSIASAREPQCPQCGYILLGLTEHRCPECGAEFASDFVETFAERSKLLAWERPELGGILRRLLKTLRSLAFSPARYFRDASERLGQPVRSARLFVVTCLGLAISVDAVSGFVGGFINFARLGIERGYGPWMILRMHFRTAFVGVEHKWSLPATLIGTDLVAIVVVAASCTLLCRRHLSSVKIRDFVALLAPVLVISSAASGLMWIVLGFCRMKPPTDLVYSAMAYSGMFVLGIATWFSVRGIERQIRAVALVCMLAACAVWYGVSMGMTYLVTQLYILSVAHQLSVGA